MTDQAMERFTIIGAGAWGTALAMAIARAGRDVTLWARNEVEANNIENQRENKKYLPGIGLPDGLLATNNVDMIGKSDAVLLAIPSQQMRGVCQFLKPLLKPRMKIIVSAKGVELNTNALMHEIVLQYFNANPIAILSGPNFAGEVAKSLPTAAVLACADDAIGKQIIAAVGSKYFRPYLTTDMVGVALGGAMKNVIAIASGVVIGMQLGENARASLVTRGLAEMARLAAHLGARPQTLMGLSGMGDLMLTCYSEQSRNFRFGLLMGQGMTAEVAVKKLSSTIEGIATSAAITRFAERYALEMPIAFAVAELVSGKINLLQATEMILSRPFKEEG